MVKKLLYNRKGLSGIITAVIMIALVMAAAVIVWGVVNSTIKGQIETTEACFGNYNKITINNFYTCYDTLTDTFHFSLSVGDIEVDSVVVAVSSEASTASYTITNTGIATPELADYGSTVFGTDLISLPGQNAGKTYLSNAFAEKPDMVQIAPIIGGQQCEVSDTLSNIELCF